MRECLNARFWAAWMVLLVLFCWCERGDAAESDTYKAEIRELFDKGRRLASQGLYRKALVKLLASLDLLRRLENSIEKKVEQEKLHESRSTILYAIGKTYYYVNNYETSVMYFARCVTTGGSRRVARMARQQLKMLWPKVKVSLVISAKPAGSYVALKDLLGDVHRGKAPWRVDVYPGTLHVLVYAEDYRSFRKSMVLKGRSFRRLDVRLEPKVARRQPGRSSGIVVVPPRRGVTSTQLFAWGGVILAGLAGITGGVLFGVAEQNAQVIEANKGRRDLFYDSDRLWKMKGTVEGMRTGGTGALIVAGGAALTAGVFFALHAMSPRPKALLPAGDEKKATPSASALSSVRSARIFGAFPSAP